MKAVSGFAFGTKGACYLAGVDKTLGFSGGVVGPNCIPCEAVACDVLRKNPGANVGVDARIKERLLINSVAAKGAQSSAVDLYMSDVI